MCFNIIIVSETPPPYVPQSRRFGSELPYVEDDVDVWCYAILSLVHIGNEVECGSDFRQQEVKVI